LKREIVPASENIEDFVSRCGFPVRGDHGAERKIERGARSGSGNNREFFCDNREIIAR
jgi:hypothetical protein